MIIHDPIVAAKCPLGDFVAGINNSLGELHDDFKHDALNAILGGEDGEWSFLTGQHMTFHIAFTKFVELSGFLGCDTLSATFVDALDETEISLLFASDSSVERLFILRRELSSIPLQRGLDWPDDAESLRNLFHEFFRDVGFLKNKYPCNTIESRTKMRPYVWHGDSFQIAEGSIETDYLDHVRSVT